MRNYKIKFHRGLRWKPSSLLKLFLCFLTSMASLIILFLYWSQLTSILVPSKLIICLVLAACSAMAEFPCVHRMCSSCVLFCVSEFGALSDQCIPWTSCVTGDGKMLHADISLCVSVFCIP